MNNYIIPTVGTRGKFNLSTPFDGLMLSGEEYTCQAVRKLADYLANNEDPLTDIYLTNGLTEADFESDMTEEMFIASLQSQSGHWLYVPVRFIQMFPDANGVPYRTVMLGVSLGAQPVELDTSYLETMISNLVFDTLGVRPLIKAVETSKTVLVSRDKHDQMTAARAQRATLALTDSAKYRQLQIDHQRTLDQLEILKDYIKQHNITP